MGKEEDSAFGGVGITCYGWMEGLRLKALKAKEVSFKSFYQKQHRGGIMGELILVVEDEKYWQDIFRECLCGFEYEACVVSNDKEAKLKLQDAHFSGVIIDHELIYEGSRDPVGKGSLLARFIKRNYPKLPILMISGKIEKDQLADILSNKTINGFIDKKNFSIPAFEEKAREIFGPGSNGNNETNESLKKLRELNDKVYGLDEGLRKIDKLFEEGEYDRDQYSRKVRKWKEDRHSLITEIQDVLADTEISGINGILEQAKNTSAEITNGIRKEEVKLTEDLEDIVQEKVREKKWGKSVLVKIDKHKDSIISSVVKVAIEFLKSQN